MNRNEKINWINNHVFTMGGKACVGSHVAENFDRGLVIDGLAVENASDGLIDAVFEGIYG